MSLYTNQNSENVVCGQAYLKAVYLTSEVTLREAKYLYKVGIVQSAHYSDSTLYVYVGSTL